MNFILIWLIGLLGLRTLSANLKIWQQNEYRFDRMAAWLGTKDGQKFWIPYFFLGILPRPKLSGRIALILTLVLTLSFIMLGTIFMWLTFIPLGCSLSPLLSPFLSINCPNLIWLSLGLTLAWERSLPLQVAIAVWISSIPVNFEKKRLFAQARKIVAQADHNLIKIGITGSFGKSSTKKLLVHLLQENLGAENILYNPANNNTEVAIARLILKYKEFFATKSKETKVLVIETGAYKPGEIATVADMIEADFGILTGLNPQHLSLFGSLENIAQAKLELAEGTKDTVFFNGDSPRLVQAIDARKFEVLVKKIDKTKRAKLVATPTHTDFVWEGQACHLPWPGEFFVQNALLALECGKALGFKPSSLAQALASLSPLERALHLETHPQGFAILRDPYSANPDGVLKAIEHLKQWKGQRVFVGMPLRELGSEACQSHTQIFQALKKIEARVFWTKPDFADLGREILGDKFCLINAQEYSTLSATLQKLGSQDVVLLESRLDSKIESSLAGKK